MDHWVGGFPPHPVVPVVPVPSIPMPLEEATLIVPRPPKAVCPTQPERQRGKTLHPAPPVGPKALATVQGCRGWVKRALAQWLEPEPLGEPPIKA
jgi:hypothetical protein